MKFLNILIFFFGFVLATGTNGQFAVSPSDADACQCTGSLTYTPPAGATGVSIVLFDQQDEIEQQVQGVNGAFTFNNLCPTVFHVVATLADGTIQDEYFNVPAGSNDPGSARHPLLRSCPMPLVFLVPAVFVAKIAAEAAIWSLFFGR